MDSTKTLLIMIFFIIFGIVFIAAGLFFMSDAYLKKLSQSVADEKKSGQLVKAGKLCGSVSMGIGAFTVFCGIIAKCFPSVFPFFALLYVIILIISFSLIIFSLKMK